jgi:arylsulfatase A-like enzyme
MDKISASGCRTNAQPQDLTRSRSPGFILALTLGLTIVLLAGACRRQPSGAGRPNVVIVLTDDQGYGDAGFNGNPFIRTPHLDRLAEQSTQFVHFYVSPVCAPTRSSLLTGRHSLRTGVRDTYNGGAIMATEEVTMAEMLRDAGYRTGVFGKWHLGDNYPFRPEDQGFEEVLIHGAGGIGQVGDVPNYERKDSAYFDPVLHSPEGPVRTRGYCSDVFTDAAIRFVEQADERPFFLYLSFNAPHTPLQAPQQYLDLYRDLDVSAPPAGSDSVLFPALSPADLDDARRVYAMVSNIDDNLGRLLKVLDDRGMADNTLFIFMTDNGPQQNRYRAGLRSLKGSVYEGGIRVPFLIRYPGEFGAGEKNEVVAAHIDVLPTVLSVCGIDRPGDLLIDGLPLPGSGEAPQEEFGTRSLVFHWQRGYPELYRNVALRRGPYKLIGQVGYRSGLEDLELYNINDDPGERNNIARELPGQVAVLRAELDRWFGQALQWENLRRPQRIAIGSDYENPVLLNRNDAGGMPGIWDQQRGLYGYWDVAVANPGNYDVRFRFNEPLGEPGQLVLRLAPYQTTLTNSDTLVSELIMDNVQLEAGEYRLETWYAGRSGVQFPFYVEFNQIDAH